MRIYARSTAAVTLLTPDQSGSDRNQCSIICNTSIQVSCYTQIQVYTSDCDKAVLICVAISAALWVLFLQQGSFERGAILHQMYCMHITLLIYMQTARAHLHAICLAVQFGVNFTFHGYFVSYKV